MGFFDEFKAAVKEEAADIKKSANKTAEQPAAKPEPADCPKKAAGPETNRELTLEEQQEALYPAIGKYAVEHKNPADFGEAGQKYLELAGQIRIRDEEIRHREEEERRRLEEEKAKETAPQTAEKVCQACGAHLRESAKFCPECGAKYVPPAPPEPAPAANVCAKCGAALREGAKFCPECGAKVEAEQGPAPAAPKTPAVCDNCGEELFPDAKFCPSCGKKFS